MVTIPTQADLEKQARTYLRENRPKDYRKARDNGELDEWIRLNVEAATQHANDLISQGVFEGEAWNRAIRIHLLESDTD